MAPSRAPRVIRLRLSSSSHSARVVVIQVLVAATYAHVQRRRGNETKPEHIMCRRFLERVSDESLEWARVTMALGCSTLVEARGGYGYVLSARGNLEQALGIAERYSDLRLVGRLHGVLAHIARFDERVDETEQHLEAAQSWRMKPVTSMVRCWHSCIRQCGVSAISLRKSIGIASTSFSKLLNISEIVSGPITLAIGFAGTTCLPGI